MGLDLTHQDYGGCLANIGIVYKDRGDKEHAIPFVLKAAIAGERVLGRDHPRVVQRKNLLARTLTQLGRTQEADAVQAGNELFDGDGSAGQLVSLAPGMPGALASVPLSS
jgi:hypothetical protein